MFQERGQGKGHRHPVHRLLLAPVRRQGACTQAPHQALKPTAGQALQVRCFLWQQWLQECAFRMLDRCYVFVHFQGGYIFVHFQGGTLVSGDFVNFQSKF